MDLKFAKLIAWLGLGAAVLFTGGASQLMYALTWGALMLELIDNLL